MSDQLRISDDGSIELGPLTWDGEPLYSVETVREGLFDPAPFGQIVGQTALDTDCVGSVRVIGGVCWRLARCGCCRQDFYMDADDPSAYCDACMHAGER